MNRQWIVPPPMEDFRTSLTNGNVIDINGNTSNEKSAQGTHAEALREFSIFQKKKKKNAKKNPEEFNRGWTDSIS